MQGRHRESTAPINKDSAAGVAGPVQRQARSQKSAKSTHVRCRRNGLACRSEGGGPVNPSRSMGWKGPSLARSKCGNRAHRPRDTRGPRDTRDNNGGEHLPSSKAHHKREWQPDQAIRRLSLEGMEAHPRIRKRCIPRVIRIQPKASSVARYSPTTLCSSELADAPFETTARINAAP